MPWPDHWDMHWG